MVIFMHNQLKFHLVNIEKISESALFDYPQDQFNKIQEVFKNYSLTYHIVSFASALYSDNCLNKHDQHDNKLRNIFNSISDLTLKEDMLMKLR